MKIKPNIRGGGDDKPNENPKAGASVQVDETDSGDCGKKPTPNS